MELKSVDITLPAAGRLVVYAADVAASGYCNASANQASFCASTIGLYVDGQPVRGDTSLNLFDTSSLSGKAPMLSGITGPLSEGTHHVTLSRRDHAADATYRPVTALSAGSSQLLAFEIGG